MVLIRILIKLPTYATTEQDLKVLSSQDIAENSHEESCSYFCGMNVTNHVSEHGDLQFRSLKESRSEDFELSFKQNITEPLIAAESVGYRDSFTLSAQISTEVNDKLERHLAGEYADEDMKVPPLSGCIQEHIRGKFRILR
jgi:hypothetical protein